MTLWLVPARRPPGCSQPRRRSTGSGCAATTRRRSSADGVSVPTAPRCSAPTAPGSTWRSPRCCPGSSCCRPRSASGSWRRRRPRPARTSRRPASSTSTRRWPSSRSPRVDLARMRIDDRPGRGAARGHARRARGRPRRRDAARARGQGRGRRGRDRGHRPGDAGLRRRRVPQGARHRAPLPRRPGGAGHGADDRRALDFVGRAINGLPLL